ncbi:hypothetical protein H9P43_003153 [Blastocladiella emersonii ATCC 22665]|nr:hypothetical protein H9P43_003153 [Blastocladiella emersonii ATCC 22665]
MDDIAQAKQYLQQQSDRTGVNLYDHLTDMIAQLLEKRPKNPADVFENVSSQLKRKKFNIESLNAPLGFKKVADINEAQQNVHRFMALLQSGSKNVEEGDEAAGQVPDIQDLAHLFESAGVYLGSDETFYLTLSIHQLMRDQSLQSARFWGKVSGLKNPYYIVEAEGGSADEEPAGEEERKPEVVKPATIDMPEFEGFPGPKKPADSTLPKEEGTGCNKYTYYACTALGNPWVRLPDVLPEHITAARSIRKLMTGDLSTIIESHPLFPGTEAHYLRAQIARITAATVVCPLGYYTFDPESADEEHPELNTAIIVNAEYEVLPNESMLTLDNWVHQIPYVMPQGRTVWVNPVKSGGDGEDGDGERNEDEERDDEDDETGDATGGESEREIEPEIGPALLTPLIEDSEMAAGLQAWSVRACSRMLPLKFTPIHLRSNRWPGAHAVYYNGKFACVYMGDGLKDLAGMPFAAPALPAFQAEYVPPPAVAGPLGLTEQNDPSVEDEKKFEEMLKEKQDDAEPDEEDGGEEDGGD